MVYLFSSPDGDLPVDADTLEKPFLLSPSEPHPNLTLGHYFESIRRFILKAKWDSFLGALNKSANKEIDPDDIQQILIRSEKHGRFYHIASIEVLGPAVRMKFALSTAISRGGKDWLHHEFEVISDLNRTTKLPYLPNVHFKDEVQCRTGKGDETMVMSLSEWFGDYHEWHLSKDEKNGRQTILIWDQNIGYEHASFEEGLEIFRKASKILTLYYDTKTFSQIYPWHHGAGDFVVKRAGGKIEVRLTTARKYEPVMVFQEEGQINPLVALIYFFLNLTLQMRLDKLEGTGEIVWAENWVMSPMLQGFIDGLRLKEEKENDLPMGVNELLELLKGFSREELQRMLNSLMDLHRHRDPEDYKIIQSNLEDHGKEVYEGIQKIRG